MTAPIDEEEVVVSLRLQPVVARPEGWRGRSSGLVAAGLVGFIVIGIALGTAFDGSRPASSAAAFVPDPTAAISPAATRRPNPTPRPQLPPLPRVQVIGGEIPTERRLVYANGMQILDLATGELTTPARPYEDLVLPLSGGDVICACTIRQLPVGDATSSSVILRFERFDTSGAIVLEREVTTFQGVVEVPEMSTGFATTATLSADDRFLFVLTAVRRPPFWVLELHQIDVSSGELVSSTVVDELEIDAEEPVPSPSGAGASASATPSGTPPDGLYVWANWLALSPDGASMAATMAYSDVRSGAWTNGMREFLIPLSDGQPATPAPLGAEAPVDPNGWCIAPLEFVDGELLVQVCSSRVDGTYDVRRVTTAGDPLAAVALPSEPEMGYAQWSTTLDRDRRSLLAWDPVRHGLVRVSLDDGTVTVRDVARAMLPEGNPSNGRGFFGAAPGLVMSPDGRRLYALGVGPGPSDSGTPTGVWVFDAENLSLIDHWRPRAMLTSLGVSADGRFVYAAGANGFDFEGHQSSWPSSVTVYDAETGEIQVIYGAVSRDAWLNFQPLP